MKYTVYVSMARKGQRIHRYHVNSLLDAGVLVEQWPVARVMSDEGEDVTGKAITAYSDYIFDDEELA